MRRETKQGEGTQGWVVKVSPIGVFPATGLRWRGFTYLGLAALAAGTFVAPLPAVAFVPFWVRMALAIAAVVTQAVLLMQQLGRHWLFDGRNLYYMSPLVTREYKVAQFCELRASRRKGPRVLALSLSGKHVDGVEFQVKDWSGQGLRALMSAILRANPSIRVSPLLTNIDFHAEPEASGDLKTHSV